MKGSRAGLVVGLLMVAAAAAKGQERMPRVGDVQRLKVITVSMKVGGTERESKQVSYTPPPGWYVRSHVVSVVNNYGHCSFTVNTVPKDWQWLSEDRLRESYRLLFEAAARAHEAGAEGRLAAEQEASLEEVRRARASHHALVVDATARGEGFFRGGSGIELSVTAEMVYVGTNESVAAEGPRAAATAGKVGRTPRPPSAQASAAAGAGP